MPRLILEPGNPHDLDRATLDDLAAELRGVSPEYAVDVFVGEERGYGVTLSEVLRIYMEAGDVAGNTAALLAPFFAAAEWARRRWHRDLKDAPDQNPRPRAVTLYGPDGEALRSVKIDLPDGEIEDDDSPQSAHKLPWPPDRAA